MKTSDMSAAENIQAKLRMAARALGNAGLAHAYGHCSVRLDDARFLVCAPEPMKTILPGEAGSVVPVEGDLPQGVLGEVRIHQHIYALRPDIGAICRIMPPAIMALSTQGISPASRHGLSAYFANDIPLWDDPALLRNHVAARKLAEALGNRLAIIMRGNGAVVVGEDLEQAVTYSWFLEDTARVEMEIRRARFNPECGRLSNDDIAARMVTTGRVFERMWRYLTFSDPESDCAE
jgi:HCOMODA/2-hydroxy-3-carboxy-muconic semialdehyde decarboxylase